MARPAKRSASVAAIIAFVDIRGFSQWSKDIPAHESTLALIKAFHALLRKHFPNSLVKTLGDGALIGREYEFSSEDSLTSILESLLNKCDIVTSEFADIVARIALASGNETDLVLGWGIARGTVIRYLVGKKPDYVGYHVNEAARLCELARPFGLVIDRMDFPHLPKAYIDRFHPQIRRIAKPGQEVKVWVTKEIFEDYLTRETLRETPEVHVAGVCVRDGSGGNVEILLAQRNEKRALFPLKWEGCGGQLRYSESFSEGVVRHYRTEMKINVSVLETIQPEFYQIERPNTPLIPGIRFICRYEEGTPNSLNHVKTGWRTVDEFLAMPESAFPPEFKSQALSLISRYRSRT